MPTVLTLDKSLTILEAIVNAPEGAGTRSLAKRFGLNVATVHNIAMTLVHRGYLRQDEKTRHFHAGLRLHLLGRAPSCRVPLVAAARDIVQRLSGELNESVLLVALEGPRFIKLAFTPGRQALRVHEPEDMSAYAHCTAVGKLLLAHLDGRQLDTFLGDHPLEKHTPATLTSRADLEGELERTRLRDYGQTRDEHSEGISAYAVPIRDPWRSVFAAIGASAPSVRMRTSSAITATLTGLRAAAAEIETLLSLDTASPHPALPAPHAKPQS